MKTMAFHIDGKHNKDFLRKTRHPNACAMFKHTPTHTHNRRTILITAGCSFSPLRYAFYRGANACTQFRDSAFTLETFCCKAWCDGPVRQMSGELAFLYRRNEHI